MVTVMVTFYNQKQYIGDSLNSVFGQKTNFEYEVLCGDDGSSDGTYEELLLWKAKYPDRCNVFQMPREQGKKYEPIIRVSNNRFNLLKHAQGKYVIFLDGDDYYTDMYKLQKQVDMLEKNPDCMACGHPIDMVWDGNPNKKQVLGYITDFPIKLSNRSYWSFCWLHSNTFLFKNVYKNSELIEYINSDFFDDNLITAYFIKYGKVIYMPDIMAAYRQIQESSWNNRNEVQKAYVNYKVYMEAKKVLPEMKFECFLKCQFAWEQLYKNRKSGIDLENKLLSSDRFLNATAKYRESGEMFSRWYDIKYFIPAYSRKIIKLLRIVRKRTYRKIK